MGSPTASGPHRSTGTREMPPTDAEEDEPEHHDAQHYQGEHVPAHGHSGMVHEWTFPSRRDPISQRSSKDNA